MRKQALSFFYYMLFSWLLLGCVYCVKATHIVGGELYYRHLGNSNYEITLIVYRDCYNGIPPFDNPASVGIFDNPFYNLVAELLITTADSIPLPPSITSPCFIPPINVCYKKATYKDTINLPANGSGYWLVYQRCCRNNTILNIDHPEDRGATYTAFIPGSQTFSLNSNPVYNDLPPSFICQGLPFTWDHSATDIDGDSIVYELCTPLDYEGFIGNPMPQPPFPPPYTLVPWEPPYNLSNILGGVPMAIDPNTGILTCTPSTVGQFVFGVCANEYRNGIYLSTTRRDYQVNVVPCSTIVVAAIQNPILNCDDNSVTFVNQSQNASTYVWNFGDTTTVDDTSTSFQPTYLYPDTGEYQVSLIAYSPLNPDCNDTVTGTVYVYPGFEVQASASTSPCSPTVQFSDTTVSTSYQAVDWYYDFGDGTTSDQHNPSHTYNAPGNYFVSVVVISDKGCSDTIPLVVSLSFPALNIASTDPVRCFGECNGVAFTGINGGTQPLTYLWNDPQHQTTSAATGLCNGNYTVVVTDSLGCIDSITVDITQPDILIVDAVAINDYCDHGCFGYALSSANGGNGNYTFLWNDPLSQAGSMASHLCEGDYIVQVTDDKGCTDTVSVVVPYLDTIPFVEASASPYVIYEGQSSNLTSTIANGYIYNWTPSATLSGSTISNPVSTPLITTQYIIEVTDSNGCKVTDTVIVQVIDVSCKEPEIFIPSAFTPNEDNENDVLKVRGSTIESLYFAVYDRWGEKVFETEDKNKGWDGFYKGALVQPDVFVYYVKAVCYDKSEFQTKGNITVIR